MTLDEAIIFFENLTSKTTKKSELKTYEDFKQILARLKHRDFSKEEMEAIASKLEPFRLESNLKNSRKYIKKIQAEFEKYLKNTFSLISKGYYTNLGIGLGSSFGILFGVVLLSRLERSLGISFGMIIGMLIGQTIGRKMDAIAKAEDRVL
jgi:SepF-like predicted cell division protein (DUF552 family)